MARAEFKAAPLGKATQAALVAAGANATFLAGAKDIGGIEGFALDDDAKGINVRGGLQPGLPGCEADWSGPAREPLRDACTRSARPLVLHLLTSAGCQHPLHPVLWSVHQGEEASTLAWSRGCVCPLRS